MVEEMLKHGATCDIIERVNNYGIFGIILNTYYHPKFS